MPYSNSILAIFNQAQNIDAAWTVDDEGSILFTDDRPLIFGTDSDLTMKWISADSVLQIDNIIRFDDNIKASFGTDSDFSILFNSALSRLEFLRGSTARFSMDVNNNGIFTGNVISDGSNTRSVGTSSLEWKNIFIGEGVNSGVFLGLGQEVRIHHTTNFNILNTSGDMIFDQNAGAGSIINSLGGQFLVRDSDDFNIDLLKLDTTTRVFDIGSATKLMVSSFSGDLDLQYVLGQTVTASTMNDTTQDIFGELTTIGFSAETDVIALVSRNKVLKSGTITYNFTAGLTNIFGAEEVFVTLQYSLDGSTWNDVITNAYDSGDTPIGTDTISDSTNRTSEVSKTVQYRLKVHAESDDSDLTIDINSISVKPDWQYYIGFTYFAD